MIKREAYREIHVASVTEELRRARRKWRKDKKKAGLFRQAEKERRIQEAGIEYVEDDSAFKSEAGERLFDGTRRLVTGLAQCPYIRGNLRPCWVFRSNKVEYVGHSLQELVKDTAKRGTKEELYKLAYYITALGVTDGQLMERFRYDELLLLAGSHA